MELEKLREQKNIRPQTLNPKNNQPNHKPIIYPQKITKTLFFPSHPILSFLMILSGKPNPKRKKEFT